MNNKSLMHRITARQGMFLLLALGALALVTWQVAFAQAPTPNPLPNAAGVDVTQTGPAATMMGDPLNGRMVFAKNCSPCHGDRGTAGIDNPGSDDGAVPALNPIDPGFLEDSHGDPKTFAADLDLFLQHGSRPAGDSPQISMPAWGDTKGLSQDQIADTEAYVMQLNGVYWPGHFYPPAQVQSSAVASGNVVTYTLTLVNHGSSPLTDVVLRDTLPPGVAYLQSGYPEMGENPAELSGTTVLWMPGDIPSGGSAGPFIIVAGFNGTNVPPNVAQALFHFETWDGTDFPSSAVSAPTSPK